MRFLKARMEHLQTNGINDAAPLIPSICDGQAKQYSSNWFRVVKAKVEKEVGVKFKLRHTNLTTT